MFCLGLLWLAGSLLHMRTVSCSFAGNVKLDQLVTSRQQEAGGLSKCGINALFFKGSVGTMMHTCAGGGFAHGLVKAAAPFFNA